MTAAASARVVVRFCGRGANRTEFADPLTWERPFEPVEELSGGVCVSAAIALTNVGETPLFAKDAGDAVLGTSVDNAAVSEAVRCARAIANPTADGHGSVEFRTHIAGVMVRRALMRAKERAV